MKNYFAILFAFMLLFSCQSAILNEKNYKNLGKGFYLGLDNKMYIKTSSINLETGDLEKSFFREVPNIDVETFNYVGLENWYAKDKNNVYISHFMSDGGHISILKEADVKTFQSIGYRWGKDINFVYESGVILDGMKPDSLVIFCPDTSLTGILFFSMVKDNDQVFWNTNEIKNIDFNTFNCFIKNDSIFYKDNDWIYNSNYFPNCDTITT